MIKNKMISVQSDGNGLIDLPELFVSGSVTIEGFIVTELAGTYTVLIEPSPEKGQQLNIVYQVEERTEQQIKNETISNVLINRLFALYNDLELKISTLEAVQGNKVTLKQFETALKFFETEVAKLSTLEGTVNKYVEVSSGQAADIVSDIDIEDLQATIYKNLSETINSTIDNKIELGTNLKVEELRTSIEERAKLLEESITQLTDSIDSKIKTALDEQLKLTQIEAADREGAAKAIGVYYLEDAFDDDPEEKAKIIAGIYLNKKAEVSHSPKLDNYINNVIPKGAYVTTHPTSVFSVSKNVGVHSDYFGADNRKVTRGRMQLTIDGQQPCIFIKNHHNTVFDFNATFIAEELGITIFFIGGNDSKQNVITTGKLRTRAYLEKGYVGGKKGLFPPIDGWTEEKPDEAYGFAAKGNANTGFNTSTLAHDLSCYDNNSVRTEKVSSGGYWDINGKHAFPQEDGTTSEKWGKWHGWNISSYGHAVTITGDKGTIVKDFDTEGFVGDAIHFGMLGTPYGKDVLPSAEEEAYREGMVAEYNTVLGGRWHGHYTGGIGCSRARHLRVSGIRSSQGKLGHPDFSVQHSVDNNGTTIDPGYGFHTSRYSPLEHLTVTNNDFGQCARKVIDAHTGTNIFIRYNTGVAGYYGIGTVTQEQHATMRDNKTVIEPTYHARQSIFDITGNHFISGVHGIFPKNGSFGMAEQKAKNVWWLNTRIRIKDNTIFAPYGFVYNFGHSPFDIENNHITFYLPFGKPFGMERVNTITLTNGGSGYTAVPTVNIVGGGEGARGASATATISNGRVSAITLNSTGTNYSEVPTIEIVGGNGTGATATATITSSAYAYDFGAIQDRGPLIGDRFVNNRSSNSPDGNFRNHYIFSQIKEATIEGNRADVTPYTKGENDTQPFISKNPHRSGIEGTAFYYSATTENTSIKNNKWYNQLTGKSGFSGRDTGDITRFDFDSSNSVLSIATETGKTFSADISGITSGASVSPEIIEFNLSNVYSKSAPGTIKHPDDNITPVIFSKNGRYTIYEDVISASDDYEDMIIEKDGTRYIYTRLKSSGHTAGKIVRSSIVTNKTSPLTASFFFEINELGNYNTGTLISAGNKTEDTNIGTVSISKVKDEDEFIISSSAPIYIDGSLYVANTQLKYNTRYHITVMNAAMQGSVLNFMGPYNGNNSISGKIFEPIIITNGITTTEAQALAAFKTANAFQAGFTSV